MKYTIRFKGQSEDDRPGRIFNTKREASKYIERFGAGDGSETIQELHEVEIHLKCLVPSSVPEEYIYEMASRSHLEVVEPEVNEHPNDPDSLSLTSFSTFSIEGSITIDGQSENM